MLLSVKTPGWTHPFHVYSPQDSTGGTKLLLKPWFHSWLVAWSLANQRISGSLHPFSGFISQVLPHSPKTCSTSSPDLKPPIQVPWPFSPRAQLLGVVEAGSKGVSLQLFYFHFLHSSVFPEGLPWSQNPFPGADGRWASTALCQVGVWWCSSLEQVRKRNWMDSNLLFPGVAGAGGQGAGPRVYHSMGNSGIFAPSCGHLPAFLESGLNTYKFQELCGEDRMCCWLRHLGSYLDLKLIATKYYHEEENLPKGAFIQFMRRLKMTTARIGNN